MNVLKKLYYGQIVPWEQIVPSDKNYEEIKQKLDELLKELEKEAEPEILEKLERFRDLSGEMENMELIETFCAGFRLGARIMQEVFTEEPENEQSQK